MPSLTVSVAVAAALRERGRDMKSLEGGHLVAHLQLISDHPRKKNTKGITENFFQG